MTKYNSIKGGMPAGTYTEAEAEKDHILICSTVGRAIVVNTKMHDRLRSAGQDFKTRYGGGASESDTSEEQTITRLIHTISSFESAALSRPVRNSDVLRLYEILPQVYTLNDTSTSEIFSALLGMEYGEPYAVTSPRVSFIRPTGKRASNRIWDYLGGGIECGYPAGKFSVMRNALQGMLVPLEFDFVLGGTQQIKRDCMVVPPGLSVEQVQPLVYRYVTMDGPLGAGDRSIVLTFSESQRTVPDHWGLKISS